MFAWSFAETFSPSEVGDITGVSTDLQREWRRKKFLPAKPDRNWSRWPVDDVVWIYMMKKLGEAGFPMKGAGAAASEATPVILAEMVSAAQDAFHEHPRQLGAVLDRWLDTAREAKPAWEKAAELIKSQATEEKAVFLIFSRDEDREVDELIHFRPVSDAASPPDNLNMWTTLDNRRTANVILSRIDRVLSAREASK